MTDNDAYTLFAAAAIVGLMNNKTRVEDVHEYADIVARNMVAAQKKFDSDNDVGSAL
jgi:hypothetical protein